MSRLLTALMRRAFALPTSYHLWCAEMELRRADAPSPALRAARARNLDLLRRYRRRGEFPINEHAEPAPRFVDDDGRLCAVAYLMDQTGGAIAPIVQHANDHRIRAMNFPELDRWAAGSGLTKQELARIQPAYPSADEIDRYLRFLMVFIVASGFAFTSIVFNTIRLIRAYRLRLTTILAGGVAGLTLLWIALEAKPFSNPGRMAHTMSGQQFGAFWLGVVAILVACIAFGILLADRVRPGWRTSRRVPPNPDGSSGTDQRVVRIQRNGI